MYIKRDTGEWRDINEVQLERGLDMLFEPPLSMEAKGAFKKLARKAYGRQHCIAWWYSDTVNGGNDFTDLCRRFGVSPGRREIIINAKNTLLFSPDYYHKPEPV